MNEYVNEWVQKAEGDFVSTLKKGGGPQLL
jgi:hypothetical protein